MDTSGSVQIPAYRRQHLTFFTGRRPEHATIPHYGHEVLVIVFQDQCKASKCCCIVDRVHQPSSDSSQRRLLGSRYNLVNSRRQELDHT